MNFNEAGALTPRKERAIVKDIIRGFYTSMRPGR